MTGKTTATVKKTKPEAGVRSPERAPVRGQGRSRLPESSAKLKSRAKTKKDGLFKKPASKRTASRSEPKRSSSRRETPAKRAQPPSRGASAAPQPARAGLSLDRKLDILGVALVLVGLLTLLSLLSPVNGSLTGAWVGAIGSLFGWGMYLLPFALLLGGGWLVLRNFERIPRPPLERVVGVVLLLIVLLAGIHASLGASTQLPLYELASQGKGGGYLGALVVQALQALLGKGGAAIALAALLLIALALTLDITLLEMAQVLTKPLQRWYQWGVQELRKSFQHSPASQEQKALQAPYPELTPLSHPAPTTSPSGALPGLAAPAASAADPAHPWVLPALDLILEAGEETVQNDELDRSRANTIEDTLRSFSAPVKVVEVNRGPTITQFGVEPDFIENRSGKMRVRVAKIVSLADDLALALSARSVRIQAPVPGKGYVGIEVPNETITPVMLRDVLESEAFRRLKSPLRFALGLNVSGQAMAYDLATMPHLLIAGTTGSGKSVCVNALICCLILNNTPENLRLIMVDPKRVELSGYNGIPHLLAPVVVDLERVVGVLQWVTREMDLRYRKLQEAGVRNIQEYNDNLENGNKMPFLVVFIDELADLMMIAPEETEKTITRLAQMARATGIHLVLATQRPSVEVVTGLIKANLPARIAFAVASNTDSRVILDQPGAERLLGRGDMLFQAPDSPAPIRLQGVYVSESEIFRLVSYWQGFAGTQAASPAAAQGTPDAPPNGLPLKQIPIWETEEEEDPLYKESVEISRKQGRASISMLQRRLRIGYTRAARLIERMEEKGIVGPPEPSTGTREILDYGNAAPPVDES